MLLLVEMKQIGSLTMNYIHQTMLYHIEHAIRMSKINNIRCIYKVRVFVYNVQNLSLTNTII